MLLSENLLLLASLLVFVAIMVSKVGSKLGAPSLLVFLLLGMAAFFALLSLTLVGS